MLSQIGEITGIVKRAATEAGFDLAGIAPVRDFAELEYFPLWIAAGHSGDMHYLEARNELGQLKRASLQNTAPWARSVVVCAINYNTAQPYSTEGQDSRQGWISRYAWSMRDYHAVLMEKLRQVENWLRDFYDRQVPVSTDYSRQQSRASLGPGRRGVGPPAGSGDLITRCYVDTGPLVERVYAKYAGVGWIGKNTCILNQKLGSWLFLGVILTSLELEPDFPAPDRCGSCTRCIDACPTNALIAPYQLDSNKCISYLTIEKRGVIPEEMRAGIGRHVFGCDICQDVCPWNRKAPATAAPEFQPRPELVNPALDWLAEMSAEQFRQTFRGSPVRRTRLAGLRRNTAIAMGNSGDRKFLPVLEKLTTDADPEIAEAGQWGCARLKSRRASIASTVLPNRSN